MVDAQGGPGGRRPAAAPLPRDPGETGRDEPEAEGPDADVRCRPTERRIERDAQAGDAGEEPYPPGGDPERPRSQPPGLRPGREPEQRAERVHGHVAHGGRRGSGRAPVEARPAPP